MDNERPIEKLLRRYAKKRRDDSAGAGLEIHPATRRMLQGEVTRQFSRPQAADAKPSPFWRLLWPRLAYALPVLVALAVGVWAILESRSSQPDVVNLAKVESDSIAPLNESLARGVAPAPSLGGRAGQADVATTDLAYAESSRAKDASVQEEAKLKANRAPELALNAPAPTAVPARDVGKSDATIQEKALADRESPERFAGAARSDKSRDLLAESRTQAKEPVANTQRLESPRAATAAQTEDLAVARRVRGKTETAGTELAGTPVSATPPPAAPAPMSRAAKRPTQAAYEQAKAAPETVVQKFVQTPAAFASGSVAKKTAGTPRVLETFQLEQTGNQLRVIDSDGSRYDGTIEPAADETLRQPVMKDKSGEAFSRRYSPAGDRASDGQSVENYAFRVAGTNRTLRQAVAFTGTVIVLTNAIPPTQTGLTLAPTTKTQFPQAQNVAPLLLNSTISGRVRLGADREMQINAVPAR